MDKATAASILGVDEKSVTHVEGEVNGKNLCLKQVPGLYSRKDAEAIKAARDQAAEVKAEEKAEKAAKAAETDDETAEKRQEVQRQEPATKVLSEVAQTVKEAVESGQTS